MMQKCPFFGICGGCKYDFSSADYRTEKLSLIRDWPIHDSVFWTAPGLRRRADFCFGDGKFGFFAPGSKDIVTIDNCPNLVSEINSVLPKLVRLPLDGTGSALVTLCDNGLDLAITSNVPYFSRALVTALEKMNFIRATWNGRVILQRDTPRIRFGDSVVDYPSGAFLQPTVASESAMRDFVLKHTKDARRIADLFCGIGNFTFATHADGFDIAGIGVRRDLFKRPLAPRKLNSYDMVIMDPPRAGALAQCKELARSTVKKIIYVSCNPETLRRDAQILTNAGYKMTDVAAFDQFTGSPHWELAAMFHRSNA